MILHVTPFFTPTRNRGSIHQVCARVPGSRGQSTVWGSSRTSHPIVSHLSTCGGPGCSVDTSSPLTVFDRVQSAMKPLFTTLPRAAGKNVANARLLATCFCKTISMISRLLTWIIRGGSYRNRRDTAAITPSIPSRNPTALRFDTIISGTTKRFAPRSILLFLL